MSNEKELSLQEQLDKMKAEKEAMQGKNKLVDAFTGTEEKKDFSQIAAELQERKLREVKGENFGFVKDTIYVREDIYKSFNALCIKHGDKKKKINEALEKYVLEEYRKLKE